MASKGKSIWGTVLTNFINSLKPKKRLGNLIGNDDLGNTYFEIPAEPAKGRRKPERYFETKVRNEYIQEVPAEWESWLRGRRTLPPNPIEIRQNMERLKVTLQKSAELEMKDKAAISAESTETPIDPLEKKAFPKFEEYELEPGKPRNKK